ncbi:MAG: hypothetical protein ACLFP1_09365, partial [Candidatus Goldiibacteriota bacterium]
PTLPLIFTSISNRIIKTKEVIVVNKRNILFIMLFLALPCGVYAYLDPGTGSFIVQMLVAAVASALLAVKIFWNSIVDFFRKIFGKGKKKK